MLKTYQKIALTTLVLIFSFSLLNCQTDGFKRAEDAKEEIKVKREVPPKYATIVTNLGEIELELWPNLAPKTVDNFNKLAGEGFYDKTYFHRVIPDFMIQGGDPNTKDDDRGNDGQGGPGYRFEDECYGPGEKVTGEVKDEETAILVWTEIIIPYMQSAKDPQKDIFDIVQQVQTQNGPEPIYGKTVEWYLQRTGRTDDLYTKVLLAPVLYSYICMANSGPNTNGSQFFIVTKKPGTPWLDGKHTVFGKVTSGLEVVHEIENLPRDKSDNPLVGNQAFINSIRLEKK